MVPQRRHALELRRHRLHRPRTPRRDHRHAGDRSETNVAYFFSKAYASGNSGPAAWKMHAVDLSNGEEEPGFPVPISGEAQNLPGVEFNPTQQLQRPALLLMNGVVYAAFGSHCDIQPYEGWIVGVSTSGQIKTMWATSSTGSAIWQAGGGLISDGEGQILFTTGNGPPPPPGPGDSPPEGELGESVARRRRAARRHPQSHRFLLPHRKRLLQRKRPGSRLGGTARAAFALLRHPGHPPSDGRGGQAGDHLPAQPRQSRRHGPGTGRNR